MVNERSVVVIGAGIAGLTAAHRLQQAGARVTVLERGAGVGGRVQTERAGGYLVDTGPDALTASYKHYLAVVRELGLESELTTPSQVVGLVRDGRIVDVDPARPWQLPTSPILSLRAKLRLTRGLLGLRRALKGIDAYDLASSAELDDPATTAREYALRHFGREAPERLIDPVIRFQHNKAPDRAPAGHSLITIYTDTLATDRYLGRSDDEIVSWAAGVIESLCPELRGHRELATVTRWPRAGYLAAPGFWRRARALRQAIPADGRIQLAGDLFGAGSMESAVASGERAAQRLADGVLADAGPRQAIAIN
jgi:protoporphyrinogen oxidase